MAFLSDEKLRFIKVPDINTKIGASCKMAVFVILNAVKDLNLLGPLDSSLRSE
jgi:hypothetical protein